MTKTQELFDKIYDNFVTQGKPQAINKITGKCLYNLGCAVGILIKDENLKLELDKNNLGSIDSITNDKLKSKVCNNLGIVYDRSNPEYKFLCSVQKIHDDYDNFLTEVSFTEYMKTMLSIIARDYYLKIPSLNS